MVLGRSSETLGKGSRRSTTPDSTESRSPSKWVTVPDKDRSMDEEVSEEGWQSVRLLRLRLLPLKEGRGRRNVRSTSTFGEPLSLVSGSDVCSQVDSLQVKFFLDVPRQTSRRRLYPLGPPTGPPGREKLEKENR